jgi:hypothetical protein
MKLSYRGNNYASEAISHLEVRETAITGKYRGHHWRYKLPQHIPQLQPKIYLQYRGIAYSTCPNMAISGEGDKCTCVPLNQKCPKLVVQNTEQVHLENLRRNLERRLDIAKAKGNYNLVEMLEKESQQLALEIQAS